jgi:hypothetical protein
MNDEDTRRARLAEGLEEARSGVHPRAQLMRKALLGALFPLSTEQLVQLARENEASPALLTLLGALPQRRFESEEAVEQALGSRLQAEAPVATPPTFTSGR